MVRARCCSCQSARNGTCKNCACVKDGKGCTDCLLSRDGLCSNRFGCGPFESKQVKVHCPFERCDAGKNGKPLERRLEDISRLRTHVSSHLKEFYSFGSVFSDHNSVLCPGCSNAIVSYRVAVQGKCRILVSVFRLHDA